MFVSEINSHIFNKAFVHLSLIKYYKNLLKEIYNLKKFKFSLEYIKNKENCNTLDIINYYKKNYDLKLKKYI